MKSSTPLPHREPHIAAPAGFTLVELMVAVVVLGVLTAVALPSFLDSIRKGRRADAFAALSAVQQAQERWRGSNGAYADQAKLTPLPSAGLGLPATTPSGYYGIALSDTGTGGYTATATAQASQVADSACKLIAVKMTGGNLFYGSGQAAIDWSDPGRCWAK